MNNLSKRDRRHAVLMILFFVAALILGYLWMINAQDVSANPKPEEPELFGYIQPGCRYYYRAGSDNYYIENRGEAVINGLFYISYQVWYEISPGGLYDFLTVGLLSPQDTHAETINIPLVGWLDHNHMYVSSSDPAKSYRWTGCPIYLPAAFN